MGCTPRRDAAGRAAPARCAAPPRARQCARAPRHAAVSEELSLGRLVLYALPLEATFQLEYVIRSRTQGYV